MRTVFMVQEELYSRFNENSTPGSKRTPWERQFFLVQEKLYFWF